MKAWLAFIVAGLAFAASGSQDLSACGDKFLLVGRGVRFDQAYAAVHPASLLIVLPAKTVKSAAVRDARLLTALKNAGHTVEIARQPADLANALNRSRHDIVLSEQADAPVLRDITVAGQAKPSIVGVLEDPSASALTSARQQVEYVLPTPTSLARI